MHCQIITIFLSTHDAASAKDTGEFDGLLLFVQAALLLAWMAACDLKLMLLMWQAPSSALLCLCITISQSMVDASDSVTWNHVAY